MAKNHSIVIAGGGTAGWLTACYLARTLGTKANGPEITVIESPEIGIIGVGEGTFPTIRATLMALGIDEARFLRESSATFKQGVRFDDWTHAPGAGRAGRYFHPFEFPHRLEGTELLPFWLLGDAGPHTALADAVTIQQRVADASRAPKRLHDADYAAPLNYAYHFDAYRFAALLTTVAQEYGVTQVADTIDAVEVDPSGAIGGVVTRAHGTVRGDLYIDCTGFRAKLIGEALKVPFVSARTALFADRAVTCQVPYDRPDSPIPSYTIATGHAAGWTWDIGLENRRGIGYVYSSAHSTDDAAEATLRRYIGPLADQKPARLLKFEAGYRERPWVRNCVAVGLAAGFFEPLESTGIMLIEVAAAMIADFFPWGGDMAAPAARYNHLMSRRCENIVNFLKLHYCTSRRPEEFWRDNRRHDTIPDALQGLLLEWRHRPPSRLDFVADLETFPHFSYQYVLYGMGFETHFSAARARYGTTAAAQHAFAQLRTFALAAARDLPAHRALIDRVYRDGFRGRPDPAQSPTLLRV